MTKILVIEDNKDMIELLESQLTKAGYAVQVAEDGQEATTMALRDKPSLILMDLMFPGGGGVEVIRRIKQSTLTAHIPVIVLTAADRDELVKLKDVGVTTFIQKPHTKEDLLEQIQIALDRKQGA